mgnify:CR=1 FL=1
MNCGSARRWLTARWASARPAVVSDLSGRYDVSDLPAGVHLVAAPSGIQEGDLHDAPMFQETAAAGAEGAIETGMVSRFDVQITR